MNEFRSYGIMFKKKIEIKMKKEKKKIQKRLNYNIYQNPLGDG